MILKHNALEEEDDTVRLRGGETTTTNDVGVVTARRAVADRENARARRNARLTKRQRAAR